MYHCVVSRLEEIECGEGDAIVFNANLIHVCTVLDKRDHLRVQLKITHRDDRKEYDKFCERRENAYVDYVVSLTA